MIRTPSHELDATPRRGRLGPVVNSALSGLRMYPRTTLLIGGLGCVALAAALPVLWLGRWDHGSVLPRLLLDPDQGAPLMGPYAQPALRVQQGALTFFFRLLAGVAGATLFVAGLAALGLAAARASQRTVEMSVRRAVGASRTALLVALALEGALLALLALVPGAGAALLGGETSAGAWPGGAGPPAPGLALVAGLTLALVLVVGLILPVAFARREQLGAPSTRPVPLFIPALQLGASLIILGAGGQLTRHAARLVAPDQAAPGSGTIYLISSTDSVPASLASRYLALVDLAAAGAESLSLATPGAALGAGSVNRITTDCGACSDGGLPIRFRRVTVTQQLVTADSFHALGTPVVAGRTFSPRDSVGAPLVAIVSRSLAQAHFQGGQPIGRRLRIQAAEPPGPEQAEWYTVVGVVDDRRSLAFGGGAQPRMTVYLNLLQLPPRRAELLVRDLPGSPTAARIARALRQSFGADAARVTRVSEGELLAREGRRYSWFGGWFRLLGLTMLLIAATGTFTLMRGWVVSLRQELGLRRAVGARRRQLFLLVLGRSAAVGLAGLGLGLWFGPAVWTGVGQAIGGGEAQVGPDLLGFSLLLLLAAVAGALVPGWRAGRTAPSELLGSAGE
jgi:putative ABC transport system permease protein